MPLLIYSILLASLSLSVSLNYYLWPELVEKLRKQFFYDLERSIKIFRTWDPGFKCIHFIPKQKRRCDNGILRQAAHFAAMLGDVLLSCNLDDAPLRSMLHYYSQLCHCQKHQIVEENVTGMAKRWETELKDASFRSSFIFFFATRLLRHRPTGHPPIEAEDEPSEIPDDVLRQALTPSGSQSVPQSKQLEATRNRARGKSTPSRESSPSFPKGQDVSYNQRSYWRSPERSPLHSIIAKPLNSKELKAGFIYILFDPDHENLLKIGHSTEQETPERRCAQWTASCKKKNYKLHNIFYRTKHANRVESLVFSDLGKDRYEIFCRCGTTHREYFMISIDEAERVIKYWVNWITTLTPYRGITLSHEYLTGMFLSDTSPSGEQKVIPDHVSLFLRNSSNREWLDLDVFLSKPARKTTPPADILQALQTKEAEDHSTEVQTILQNQASDTHLEPEKIDGEPTNATSPEESANRVLETPEITLPLTPLDSEPGSFRRLLFPATSSAKTTAPSSPLPSPATMPPSPSLPTSLTSSPASSSENICDAEEETPLKPKARRGGSGAKYPRQRREGEPDDGLVLDPVEPKVLQRKPRSRRKVSNIQARTDRPTLDAAVQSSPIVPLRSKEIIDLTLEDEDSLDPNHRRRASAPQRLLTPPDSGISKRRTSPRRLNLDRNLSAGEA
ncbi:T5orf172 domain-containing protein [Cladophialophora immunda]|nr:T5orf172 domain-containing protein [Cladophialophora immunda]